MTINNNNEHVHTVAFQSSTNINRNFCCVFSSFLFFLNNIARHFDIVTSISTWPKAIEKAKSAGQQSLAPLRSQPSKRLSSCKTWPSEKKQSGSKSGINMTWKHSEAVERNVFWWMKLMIRTFFKRSAGQHKRHGVSPVRPTTHISWPQARLKPGGRLELRQLTNLSISSTLQPNSKPALTLMSVYARRFNSISLSHLLCSGSYSCCLPRHFQTHPV